MSLFGLEEFVREDLLFFDERSSTKSEEEAGLGVAESLSLSLGWDDVSLVRRFRESMTGRTGYSRPRQ